MAEIVKVIATGETFTAGTCSTMDSLRAEHAPLVTNHGSHNLNPTDPYIDGLRFRFPFPTEDSLAVGQHGYDGNAARVATHYAKFAGEEVTPEQDHSKVQFRADAGYLVSLPCPEGAEGAASTLTIHRNGYNGGMQVEGQKVVGNELWLVVTCRSCRSSWSYDRADAEKVAAYFDTQAKNERATAPENLPAWAAYKAHGSLRTAQVYEQTAQRIRDGYENPPAWVAARQPATVNA